jgi:hypothetical protein
MMFSPFIFSSYGLMTGFRQKGTISPDRVFQPMDLGNHQDGLLLTYLEMVIHQTVLLRSRKRRVS